MSSWSTFSHLKSDSIVNNVMVFDIDKRENPITKF